MIDRCIELKTRLGSVSRGIEYFKRILYRYPLNHVFYDEELLKLFKCYDKYREKVGDRKVVGFLKKPNPRNKKSFALYAVLSDGSLADWSYRKAVLSLFGSRNSLRHLRVVDAFRRAVEDQIKEFRDSRRFGKYVVVDGGGLVPIDEVDVHHEPPFATLVSSFLKHLGLRLDDIPIKPAHDGIGNDIADPKLREAWREYHKRHARLHLLPKEKHREFHKQ